MSQSSLIRLAVALTILKVKPRDQSIASYLFDLQSCFPSATHDRDWRTYALELEKQLATFKAQRDVDQELFSKLLGETSHAPSTSDAPPPKKKSRKNANKDNSEWNWDQSRADWSRFLSSQYPSSPSLVAVYASLGGIIASPNADLPSYASCITDAILRALDAIRVFLFSSPDPSPVLRTQTMLGTPSQLNPHNVDSPRIAMTSPLLMYLLRTAFPALLRTVLGVNKRQRQRMIITSAEPHVHIDRVLDHLLECVLLPLLRALVPLCFAHFAPLIAPPPRKLCRPTGKVKNRDRSKDKRAGASLSDHPKSTDTRTDAFALIGASLDALDALLPLARPGVTTANSIAGGIRDRLGLEAIRELEALFPPSSLEPSPEYGPEPCSQVSPTLTPLSAPRSQPQSQGMAQQRTVPVTGARVKRLERLARTRAERVRVLATRDAGWFLASTLSLCVPPAEGPGPSDPVAGKAEYTGVQLREALLDRVGKLIRSVQGDNEGTAVSSKLTIDPVCQNMLLAICERAMTRLNDN